MSLCPVCGFELDFTPWEGGQQTSEKLCHSCGICFGLDDVVAHERQALYDKWRARWIHYGKRWWSSNPQPADFDPDVQLKRIGVGINGS